MSLENSFVVKIGAKCQALYRRTLPWLPLLLGLLNLTWLVLFPLLPWLPYLLTLYQ